MVWVVNMRANRLVGLPQPSLGQIVSQVQVSRPDNNIAWSGILHQALGAANRCIYELSHASESLHSMGTTIALALIVDGRVHVAWVGDSRVYRITEVGT